MKHFISVNHIGYAVRDIHETAQKYLDAGWCLSDICEERVQRARIAFLTKSGFPPIELVAPLKEGEASPVDTYLQRIGCCPYHICYDVEDIDIAVEDLFDEGFSPLFEPVESEAMNGRRICYLFNLLVGLIELVENRYSDVFA